MVSTSEDRPLLTQAKYKSKLEDAIAAQLEAQEIPFTYEEEKLSYVIPERKAKYTPDFRLNGKSFWIEAKGHFGGPLGRAEISAATRQKLILIKDQGHDVRLVFDPKVVTRPIYKGCKTTHGKWATDHGFPWAVGLIPDSWLKEALDS